MNAEGFERVRAIFLAACELDPPDRTAFVRRSCGDDHDLCVAVSEMLSVDADPARLPHTGMVRDRLVDLLDRVDEDPAPPHDDDADRLPEDIAGFTIIRKIGEGGMGVVFEVEQAHPRRTVALKLLRHGIAGKPMLSRFRREIEVLGRLQHPGIAQIHEAGTATIGGTSQPFFTMELIRGRPLREYADHHELGTRDRCSLIARLCDAAHHAHAHNIVHRDLKPANVLVDESPDNGGVGQPKILDFGVARALATEMHTTTMRTDVGQLVGTLAYMSPEQVMGDPTAIDARSDVYALGVILYELLTGCPPYDLDGRSVPDAARIIRDEEPTRLSTHARNLRGDPETIVARALAKEPQRRYQSAADVAADLRRYLNDQPIIARPPSAVYHLSKFARRNRSLVAGCAATLGALVIGLVFSLVLAARATDSERAARWQAYTASITAATAALRDDDVPTARRALNDAPEEHRGWEWRYLDGQLSSWIEEIDTTRIPGSIGIDHANRQLLVKLTDNTIGVWEQTEHGTWAAHSMRHNDLQETLSVSRNTRGDLVAIGTANDGVHLWDRAADTIRPLAPMPPGSPFGVRFCADGSHVIVRLRGDATNAVVVDVASGRAIFTGPYRDLVDLSRDSTIVASASLGRVGWHDITRGTSRDLFETAEDPLCLALSPDRTCLAVGTYSRSIYLLNPDTGDVIGTLFGHQGPVNDLDFSPDGTLLASGSDDHTIRVWNVARRDLVTTHFTGMHQPYDVRFTPDGGSVISRAAVDGAHTSLLRWPAVHERSVLVGHHSSYVTGVAVSPDGAWIASGAMHSGPVSVWRIDQGPPAFAGQVDRGTGYGLSFSADSRHLHTTSGIWRTSDFTQLSQSAHAGASPTAPRTELLTERRYANHSRTQRASIIDLDGWQRMFSRLELRSFDTDELIATSPFRDIADAAFSPDDRHLATAHEDGTIRLWDANALEEVAVLSGHSQEAFCVAYSPDGARLASGSNDNTIRIWDAATGVALLELRGHDSYVFDVVFSSDGTKLFSGSGDKTVRMWEAPK